MLGRTVYSAKRHFHPIFALAVIIKLAMAHTLSAQALRITVRDSSSGLILQNVTATLLDSSGNPIRSAWAGDDGTIVLQAQPGEKYSVRLRRIGYRSNILGPLALSAGQSSVISTKLRSIPRLLAGVHTVGNARCEKEPEPTAASAWQAAREAFSIIADADQRTDLVVKVLDASTQFANREDSLNALSLVERVGRSANPYPALDPDSISRYGYVRSRPGATWYLAPDARTLTSESFYADHCFTLGSLGESDTTVSVAFAPVSGRTIPDIRGSVVLDRQTSAVRSITFSYTGLPRSVSRERYGGSATFAEIAGAGWLTSHWEVRAPVIETAERTRHIGNIGLTGTLREVRSVDSTLAGTHVESGRLLTATTSDRRVLWAEHLVSISGVARDSDTKAPLGNVTVQLIGSPRRGTSTPSGEFTIDSVLPGRYMLLADALSGASRAKASLELTAVNQQTSVVVLIALHRAVQETQRAYQASQSALCESVRKDREREMTNEFARTIQTWAPRGRDSVSYYEAVKSATVVLEGIVDTIGAVDMSTVRAVKAGPSLVFNAAYAALGSLKVSPDMPREGCKVRRLIIFPFNVGTHP